MAEFKVERSQVVFGDVEDGLPVVEAIVSEDGQVVEQSYAVKYVGQVGHGKVSVGRGKDRHGAVAVSRARGRAVAYLSGSRREGTRRCREGGKEGPASTQTQTAEQFLGREDAGQTSGGLTFPEAAVEHVGGFSQSGPSSYSAKLLFYPSPRKLVSLCPAARRARQACVFHRRCVRGREIWIWSTADVLAVALSRPSLAMAVNESWASDAPHPSPPPPPPWHDTRSPLGWVCRQLCSCKAQTSKK